MPKHIHIHMPFKSKDETLRKVYYREYAKNQDKKLEDKGVTLV